MSRDLYPTDLTDGQWRKIAMLIPPAKPGGRPRTIDMREILNAIVYILCAGCARLDSAAESRSASLLEFVALV